VTRVMVVGSLNGDHVLDVPHLPLPGDTVVGTGRAEILPGGKGANQAAAAASLGGATAGVSMIGCVGDDPLGRRMTKALAELGVDVTGVRTVDGSSGRATIAVDPDGQNLILVDAGANAHLTAKDVETDGVRDASAVLVQLESPPDSVAAALRHATGIRILNPAPAAGAAGLLTLADVVVPNRTELALIADAPVARTRDEVVDQVRSLGLSAAVVVTLGPDGVLVLESGAEPVLVPSARVDVVDTTGAGDCFCGVLALELAGGRPLLEASRTAVSAASLSVTGVGARGRLPRPSDPVLR
jgi:ribokinase